MHSYFESNNYFSGFHERGKQRRLSRPSSLTWGTSSEEDDVISGQTLLFAGAVGEGHSMKLFFVSDAAPDTRGLTAGDACTTGNGETYTSVVTSGSDDVFASLTLPVVGNWYACYSIDNGSDDPYKIVQVGATPSGELTGQASTVLTWSGGTSVTLRLLEWAAGRWCHAAEELLGCKSFRAA